MNNDELRLKCIEDDCNMPACDQDLCEEHLEYYYCECGNKLEDSYGQPGDGLCRSCD
jgi:hypothetical protein